MYPTSQTVDETREARICFPTFEEGQNPGVMDIIANTDRTFAEFVKIFHQSVVDGKFQRFGSKATRRRYIIYAIYCWFSEDFLFSSQEIYILGISSLQNFPLILNVLHIPILGLIVE